MKSRLSHDRLIENHIDEEEKTAGLLVLRDHAKVNETYGIHTLDNRARPVSAGA